MLPAGSVHLNGTCIYIFMFTLIRENLFMNTNNNLSIETIDVCLLLTTYFKNLLLCIDSNSIYNNGIFVYYSQYITIVICLLVPNK